MPVRPYDQNQLFLLPPSLSEWVRSDHPAPIFSDIIDRLDISKFQEIQDEGRPRFDTRMMLKVLLWGYASGIRASRKIEERLFSDVVFMWLEGLEKPDFRTLCHFRKKNLGQINTIFSQTLLLAGELGLLRLGLLALDGTKVRASASIDSFKKAEDWAKELEKVREQVTKILTEAAEADGADDRKYGSGARGDEVPDELREARTRIKKIESLLNQIPSAGKETTHRISMTDPEANLMHHKNGSIPAYNAQAAVTQDQIIVHADVTTEPVVTNQLIPCLKGIKETTGGYPDYVLADAGFNSGKNLAAMEGCNINGYIPEGSERDPNNICGRESGLYSKEDFRYNKEEDAYFCPQGKALTAKRKRIHTTKYSSQEVIVYRTGKGVCLTCGDKKGCTESDNSVGR